MMCSEEFSLPRPLNSSFKWLTTLLVAITSITQLTIGPGLVNQLELGPQNTIQLIPISAHGDDYSLNLSSSSYLEFRKDIINVTALAELLSLALLPYPGPNPSGSDGTVHSESLPGEVPVVTDDSGSGGSMSDGTSMQSGKTTDGSGLIWQSSGKLTQGDCPKTVLIRNCYTLKLSENPNQDLDPGGKTPRQRIEFMTPGYEDGSTATFTWNTFLDSSVTCTQKFFHLFQLYSRGDSGPVITLDAKNQYVSILDITRCPSDCGEGTYMSLDEFKGRTISHALKVTFGPSGRIDYVLGDTATRQVEMGYSVRGGTVGSQSTSLKFGTYRSAMAGMGASLAYVGDFRSH